MKQAKPRKGIPSYEECRAMWGLCLSANLRRTERLVTRHYDAYLEQTGVSAVQLPILGIVAVADEPSFRLLADELELDRSTLSRNLSVLQRGGMLTIGASSGPKPGKIALTTKGRATLRRAHALWTEAHRALENALSGQELSTGLTFLRSLRRGARPAKRQ